MSSLRGGMVTITLVVCAGLAAAAHTGLGGRTGGDDTDTSLMDETTGSVGSRSRAELALSDEQRGRIFDGVMLVPDAQVAHMPAPAVADPPASPATCRSLRAINSRNSTTGSWSSIRPAEWSSR
jgi:hypothetical protein